MSNYLLWQSAYSELVFRDELWPDFTREAFEAALDEYARAPAPVRGPLMAAGRGGREPAAVRRAPQPRRRAATRATSGARILVAIPALAFAGVHRRPRRLGLRRRRCSCSARSACTSCSRCSRARNPSRLAGFLGARRAARRRRSSATPTTVLLAFVDVRAARVPARASCRPRRSGAPGVSVTLLGLTWIGLAARARGAAARPAARRRDRRSTCSSGRSSATPAPTSAAARSATRRSRRRSRRTRPSRAWSIGIVVGDRAASGSPGSTRTGCRAPTRCCSASAVAVAAPLGDLFESYLKRDAGTKDTGRAVRRARRRAGPPRRRAVRARSPGTTSGRRCCSAGRPRSENCRRSWRKFRHRGALGASRDLMQARAPRPECPPEGRGRRGREGVHGRGPGVGRARAAQGVSGVG